jgi:hypothetical protein
MTLKFIYSRGIVNDVADEVILVAKNSMKVLFTCEVVQVEGVRNVKQVITIELIVHLRAKLWHQFNNLPYVSQLEYITHL